jgi:hypothetical protein
MHNKNGLIVFEGASAIDGAPIVVILTRKSKNTKTGDMIQSWIIRSDVDPVAASKTGEDSTVCGNCPHRPILARATGDAPCYVNLARAPLAIFNAYRRGRYSRAQSIDQVRAFVNGAPLRLGAYGDPFAAPAALWRELIALASGHTGYSHQWLNPRFNPVEWAPLVMASVDSQREADIARAMGLRTFRVSIGVDHMPGEISCPASAEAGARVQCAKCQLCAGTSKAAKNIVIADHAAGAARRVITLKVAA